jgi:dihydrodipicolinate synthase/N-acetylneuraminate lyase
MARAGRQLELSGVIASAITPHRGETPEVDFSGALDLIDFLAQAGVRGVSLFGATGEFLNYSFPERQRLVYLGTKRSRVPLIANVSHSTLTGAIQLADEAITSGADGLLLMPPYFYRYSQAEIEQFYCQFARETSGAVPVLLHNHPQFSSPLEIETVRRLAATGLYAGIEDCSGDPAYMAELLELKRARPFAVLAGNERIAAQALHDGADAIVSGCACAIPELVVALSRAIAAGDRQKADTLNTRLLEFVSWTEQFPAPAAIKRAVALRKQKSGSELIPLAPATSRLLEEFSAWFVKWLPAASA